MFFWPDKDDEERAILVEDKVERNQDLENIVVCFIVNPKLKWKTTILKKVWIELYDDHDKMTATLRPIENTTYSK